MFSTGQLIFALVFIVVFIVVMVIAYRKDLNIHRKNYKGVLTVGIFFVIFFGILLALKYFLKN